MLDQRSRGNGGGACAQSGNLPHTPSPFIFHSVFLTVTHGFRASYIQPTWKAWMGPPLQQSVTQPVIARYVRLSASPCRLSRVHAAGGQRVHAGCRSCVGKRCIVSALTRCVANINQDNRRILRLSSVGSLPLAKNALHSPTSIFMECVYGSCMLSDILRHHATIYHLLPNIYLTLGAHARGSCVCVCLCVCLSVCYP